MQLTRYENEKLQKLNARGVSSALRMTYDIVYAENQNPCVVFDEILQIIVTYSLNTLKLVTLLKKSRS